MMMKKKIKMISISFDNEFAACHMLIFNNGNIPLHMPRSRITHTQSRMLKSHLLFFFIRFYYMRANRAASAMQL